MYCFGPQQWLAETEARKRLNKSSDASAMDVRKHWNRCDCTLNPLNCTVFGGEDSSGQQHSSSMDLPYWMFDSTRTTMKVWDVPEEGEIVWFGKCELVTSVDPPSWFASTMVMERASRVMRYCSSRSVWIHHRRPVACRARIERMHFSCWKRGSANGKRKWEQHFPPDPVIPHTFC